MELSSPIPGDDSTFGEVVPDDGEGGPANVAVQEHRWQWITTPDTGVWARFRQWQPANQNIELDEVTNRALQINFELPALREALDRLALWQPPQ